MERQILTAMITMALVGLLSCGSAIAQLSEMEAICAPVLIDLIPNASVQSEYYYLYLEAGDPSDTYLSYLKNLANRDGRSENLRKGSQLKHDQVGDPELKAVNVFCERPRWEAADRVVVTGGGLIAPKPGAKYALGGHWGTYTLERQDGVWVIVDRGPLAVS